MWEVLSPPMSAWLAHQAWPSTGMVISINKTPGAIVIPTARSRVGEWDFPGVSFPALLRLLCSALLSIYQMQSFEKEEE